jgi:hypothetical protein
MNRRSFIVASLVIGLGTIVRPGSREAEGVQPSAEAELVDACDAYWTDLADFRVLSGNQIPEEVTSSPLVWQSI